MTDGVKCGGPPKLEGGPLISGSSLLIITFSKRKYIFTKDHLPQCGLFECNPLLITVTQGDDTANLMYGIGADVSGRDPRGRFGIDVLENSS